MGDRVEYALMLVSDGMPIAAAAKSAGLTRSAVYQALAVRKARVARSCSECGGALPADAKASALTCSGACRAKRGRRLRAEKADRLAAEVERLKAGMRRA